MDGVKQTEKGKKKSQLEIKLKIRTIMYHFPGAKETSIQPDS